MNRVIKDSLLLLKKIPSYIEGIFDHKFQDPEVQQPQMVGHLLWPKYLVEIANKPGMRVLEIGSREVTGKSSARNDFDKAHYLGFDYYSGDNVDIVGDAHRLSSYFEGEEKFDLIYSSACFEHFAMPWLVAAEIAKLLKVGGHVFVETHFSFSSHERPWNFFQFSDMGLKVLFSPALGITCIDSGMSNPIVGRFSKHADAYLKYKPVKGLYCHSQLLGQKTKHVENYVWDADDLDKVVSNTTYPKPSDT